MDLVDVRQAFVEYARFERRFRPATLTTYLQAFDRFVGYLASQGKPLTTEAVDPAAVRGFKRELFKRGLVDSTVSNRIFGLRAVFRYCVLEGYMVNNPADQVDAPARRQSLPVFLTQDEHNRFLETPVQPHHALRFGCDTTAINEYLTARDTVAWRLLAFCGLRIGELSSLDLADLDLGGEALMVRNGKGGQDRPLPLLGGLVEDLRRYMILRYQLGGDSPALFLSWTGKRWRPGNIRTAFYQHRDRCGITRDRVTPHTLRHTFATMLAREGVILPTLQNLMGHADIRSTMIYVHTGLSDARHAMDKHPWAGSYRPAEW